MSFKMLENDPKASFSSFHFSWANFDFLLLTEFPFEFIDFTIEFCHPILLHKNACTNRIAFKSISFGSGQETRHTVDFMCWTLLTSVIIAETSLMGGLSPRIILKEFKEIFKNENE